MAAGDAVPAARPDIRRPDLTLHRQRGAFEERVAADCIGIAVPPEHVVGVSPSKPDRHASDTSRELGGRHDNQRSITTHGLQLESSCIRR
jgi:hypothetical protein